MNHDVIIIGGSFAGLSAAVYIARARRSVCIIDAGKPRNRFATHSHGFFAMDGSNPLTMLSMAREQLKAYPTVNFIQGESRTASPETAGFSITLTDGQIIHGKKLILAFGLSDELPSIPGIQERWGISVLHCPYCHGYEFSEQPLGVLYTYPMSIHQAQLIPEWGPTTFFLNGTNEVDPSLLIKLEARGVTIEPEAVARLEGRENQLEAVVLQSGRKVKINALYVGPRTHLNSNIAEQLGCEMEEAPSGLIIRTDAQKLTSVPDVYAAGDITRGAHNVTWACSDGVMAGVAVHRSLVFPD